MRGKGLSVTDWRCYVSYESDVERSEGLVRKVITETLELAARRSIGEKKQKNEERKKSDGVINSESKQQERQTTEAKQSQ